MKIRIPICAAMLLFCLSAVSALAQNSSRDRARFVGAWKLKSLERPGSNERMTRTECSGMFVFTADGHLSVQVMERAPNANTVAAGSQQYSQGGYEASYGTYVVDEQARTFTFHVEGALVRSLIGKDLPRRYEINGNKLIIESTRPDEHWRVTWVRY